MTGLASYQPGLPYFFDRRYQVDITPLGRTSGVSYGNEKDNSSALRVSFEVERNFATGADKGKITIYNLAPQNRANIQRGTTMRLRAGYRGRIGLIFTGFVRKVTTDQNGPDVVTVAELGDGEPAITYGTVNRAYLEPVSLARVIQDLASDLDLEIAGNVVNVAPGVIKGIPNKVFPMGLAVSGGTRGWLDIMLRQEGLDWSIQNGKLVILPQNAVQYVTAVVLSKATGMIGVPAFSEKYLKVSSLMNHQLLPGSYVQVDSDNKRVSGYYRLASVKYQGDSHDSAWNVECEGELLKSPLPFVPTAQGANLQTAVIP